MTEQVYYQDVDTGNAIPVLTVTVDETQMFFFSAARPTTAIASTTTRSGRAMSKAMTTCSSRARCRRRCCRVR